MTATLLARGQGEHFHVLNPVYTAKINSEDSRGAITAMEFVAPKNFGPPLHRHDVEDELLFL